MEYINHLIAKLQLSLRNQHANGHACNAFAHGIACMPHPRRIRGKSAFTDDFPIAHQHNLVNINALMKRQIL